MRSLLLLVILACLGFTRQEEHPVFKFSDREFEVGSIMTRRSISFTDECKTKLKPSKTLDSLAKLLSDHLNLKVEIGVHAGKPCTTCSTCSPTQNAANAMLDYLVKKGIDKKRLLAKGYGQTFPLEKETSDAKQNARIRKLNERVVFKITYNKF
ncbi:MAG TPA: OmpA family protein [Bacteroidia bacterium]|jgi:outer membrane protein OmpA-like peptidoglycan-associated protein